MFGPSPIRPIEQHIRVVYQCAKQLHPFFEAVLTKDWLKAEALKNKIASLEKEADTIKRELRLHLPTGLFLPVSRTDILQLITDQDEIANKAQDIAELLTSRHMHIPEQLAYLIMPFLDACLHATKQACKAINELDELLESGFRGQEVKIVEEMIVVLDKIEHECDEKLAELRLVIFGLEKEMPAIEIFFLYKLVYWIGELADQAQVVGARLQILIAR